MRIKIPLITGAIVLLVGGVGLGCVVLFFSAFEHLFAPIELTQRRLESYRKRLDENRDALTDLTSMIQSEGRIRTVGPVLVQGVTSDSREVAFFQDSTKWGRGKWSNRRSLQDVLNEVGMSREHYDAYVRALKRVDGRWVTRPTSRTVVVNLVSSGILTNAVNVDYLWAPDGLPAPRTPAYGEGDEVEFEPLEDDWYLRIQRD